MKRDRVREEFAIALELLQGDNGREVLE